MNMSHILNKGLMYKKVIAHTIMFHTHTHLCRCTEIFVCERDYNYSNGTAAHHAS